MVIGEEVGAILVRTDGNDGTLRITGSGLVKEVEDIDTGLERKDLILVAIWPNQQRTVFGNPSMRMFRRS